MLTTAQVNQNSQQKFQAQPSMFSRLMQALQQQVQPQQGQNTGTFRNASAPQNKQIMQKKETTFNTGLPPTSPF